MNYQELLDGIEKYYKEHKTEFEYLHDDEKIKIMNIFQKVYIPKGVVKTVWSLCYINILHYATFMNGVKANTPIVNPNKSPYVYRVILEKREQIEKYFRTLKENAGSGGMPDVDFDVIGEVINPSYQPYISHHKYYVVNQICSYALFFLLMHEYAHNICPIQMPTRSEWGCTGSTKEEKGKSQEIENWCDEEAFRRYKKVFLEKIEFKNVTFAYPTKLKQKILRNVSLVINPGEKVGLVGYSGSGKSTIIQLIERYYDASSGQVLIDNINIKYYNLYELRKKIGLVGQEPISHIKYFHKHFF